MVFMIGVPFGAETIIALVESLSVKRAMRSEKKH